MTFSSSRWVLGVTTSLNRSGSISVTIFRKLVLLMGFDKKPDMPELKHSLTLLSSANAVKAIMGLRYLKLLRMILVAVNPSIFGICTSMKIASNNFIVSKDSFTNSTASAPLAAMVMFENPSNFNILLITSWLTELSSATRILKCERRRLVNIEQNLSVHLGVDVEFVIAELFHLGLWHDNLTTLSQGKGESEGRTFTNGRPQGQRSMHHLSKLTTDRQSQTGTSITSGEGLVTLDEGLEHLLSKCRFDTGSSVSDLYLNYPSRRIVKLSHFEHFVVLDELAVVELGRVGSLVGVHVGQGNLWWLDGRITALRIGSSLVCDVVLFGIMRINGFNPLILSFAISHVVR